MLKNEKGEAAIGQKYEGYLLDRKTDLTAFRDKNQALQAAQSPQKDLSSFVAPLNTLNRELVFGNDRSSRTHAHTEVQGESRELSGSPRRPR